MGELTGIAVVVVLLLLLLGAGVPVAFALLASSFVAFALILPPEQITVTASTLWSSMNSSVLAAVPLFILMGELFARSRMSQTAYAGMAGILDRLPGGLLHSNIAACAVFAAASGTSVGTAAAMGRVATPQLNERNYPRPLTYGSLAAGGTLGILIPPSIALIIYGLITSTSIVRLFAAGLIPGLALALLFVLLIGTLSATYYKGRMPRPEPLTILRKLWGAIGVVPLLAVIGLVLGSLYFGLATPTESGAIAVLGMAVLATAGRIGWRSVLEALRATVGISGMVLTILMSAALMSYIFTVSGISSMLGDAAADFTGSRYLILLLMAVVFLVLGMFLDPISVLALTLPVAFPVAQSLGFDPIWFGVFVVVNIELGLITPPIGLNLFVIKGVDPTAEWRDILLGSFPFAASMLLFLVILALWPPIALWLPGHI
jgi:C4-dicarboxylate transporter, DctM subunit